jgi:TfoX/Sxy family transcriptional regulator of competence genes
MGYWLSCAPLLLSKAMASKQRTLDFILEQIAGSGSIRAKKMFGEYGIYCDEKMVALICDDQLFLKPTQAGRAFLGDVAEGHPYPGSKPWFLISDEKWDEQEWMATIVRLTAAGLPLPAIKTASKTIRRGKARGARGKGDGRV